MDTLYNIVQHAHSGLRWIVLILLVAAIIQGFAKRREGTTPYPTKNKLGLYAFISTHIQLLLGLALWIWLSPYALSYEGDIMSNRLVRFYTVEHFTGMILGIGLITFGYIQAKRQAGVNKGWKTIGIFYLIGLVIILASIPWPGRGLEGGWF